MSWTRTLVACAVASFASGASATVRVDFVLTPPMPPEGYQPNTDVLVDVYLVDEPGGNPGPYLLVRGVQFDFTATSDELDYMVADNPDGLGWFDWEPPEGIGLGEPPVDYEHETTSWIWPLANPFPGLQLEIPIGGSARAGDFVVNTGTVPGAHVLAVVDPQESEINYAAFVSVGFGMMADPTPPTNFWPGAGLTGGVTPITVVPEPATLALFACAARIIARRGSRAALDTTN